MYNYSLLALHSATTSTGIALAAGAGVSIAVVCSWTRNRSIMWAFIAGVLGYIYVIYWIMTREKDELRY